jgi:NADH dehydrogenase [ubiquinone] 1 alpha subcomplex assembly factor 5
MSAARLGAIQLRRGPGCVWRLVRAQGLATSRAAGSVGPPAAPAAPGAGGDAFDRRLHRLRKDMVARDPQRARYEYLHEHVAAGMADRLADIARVFPVAADLGSRSGVMARKLRGVRGVTSVHEIESSEALLRATSAGAAAGAGGGSAGEGALVDGVRVRWSAAEEAAAPLEPASVDLVTSCLSLHWVNGLDDVLLRARLALRPDGVFMAAMLGGDTLEELRSALIVAEQEREGGLGLHMSPLTDGGSAAGTLLSRAGFTLTTVDTERLTVDYADAFELMEHLQGMGASSAALARRPRLSRDTLVAAAAAYSALYGNPDGTVPATFHIIHMIGWAPAASQPRPLARGAAKRGLAAAAGDASPAGSILMTPSAAPAAASRA